jgi:UDP-N-acetylglucosamine--dolichyl-phosphate N-acetylglucosaminephosphotransferase
MENILFLSILIGFFTTLFTIPSWIRRAKNANLVGKDIHKFKETKVAESGGICVLLGFFLGVLSFIAIRTFYFKSVDHLIEVFVLLLVVGTSAMIGFVDDILGWKIGLNKKTRLLFLFFASIPLVVINAGESNMLGIDFGLFYPLLIIPLGVVGATATFNFLAGYNGLEMSQGILILSGLSFVSYMTGNSWLALIGVIMIACIFCAYIFNRVPAKIFPGDVFTYMVGSMVAVMAILGNMEKIAVLFFIPYILETILKIRGKLKKESFAKVQEDGTLINRYDKFYGLEHIAVALLIRIKGSAREKEVVYLINGFQILIIALGVFLFRANIFI